MKKIAKSVGRRNSKSVARQVMNHHRIRQCILRFLGRLIQKDMGRACSTKTPSMLQKRTAEAMKSFNWEDLLKELEATAPHFIKCCKSVCLEKGGRHQSVTDHMPSVTQLLLVCVAQASKCEHEPGPAYCVGSSVQVRMPDIDVHIHVVVWYYPSYFHNLSCSQVFRSCLSACLISLQ